MEKYDVLNVVGEGSYGIVMKCRHRESGQFVAIKKFLETEDDPTVRKMAVREIRMLKKLRHENLVNMLEVFRRKKRFFLVFEYLEHTVLEELEARVGGLGFIISRKYIYQILRAIDFIHSHNIIHRDIKPENVLVSRLGVIKVCDFGFARPFTENETFTDYVATRWYRSPELLVGDPRYGKEVDIWAIGCLYAEMMTGDPLFPGESDIDQLFQIVRVLGKLNTRHQILITQNSMFKGMKQEQNTSLFELFPDWNQDSLNFLQQCLKMDGNERPNTEQLLKHNLFTKDNFIENFIPELRMKINQESQLNPLLKKFNFQNLTSSGSANNRNNDEKLKITTGGNSGTVFTTTNVTTTITPNNTVTTTTTINNTKSSESLGKFTTNSNNGTSIANKERDRTISQVNFLSTLNAHRPSYGTEEQLAPFRHYLTNAATLAAQSKQQQQQQSVIKQISINNLVFHDDKNNTTTGSTIITNTTNNNKRVLSAKLQKINNNQQQSTGTGTVTIATHLEPPSSPVPFQSLQHDISSLLSLNHQQDLTMQGKRLSPVNNNINGSNNLSSITGQYFNQKRNSNILGLQQVHSNQSQKINKISSYLHNSQIPLRSSFSKTSNRSSNLLDINNLLPITATSTTAITTTTNSDILSKDISPRILPPPQTWLINNNNKNINNSSNNNKSLLQTSTILSSLNNLSTNNQNINKNSSILNNKKLLTDWKTIARDYHHYYPTNPNDFLYPNCPGIITTATPTSLATSPYKGNKKKLSPMSITQSSNNQDNKKILESSVTLTTTATTGVSTVTPATINQTKISRNFSASSDQENEN